MDSDTMFDLKAEAAAIRCAELLDTIVCIDTLYSDEEVEIEGGKKKTKIRKRSQQRTKIALAAKRLAEHKDAIVWGRIPAEKAEKEAVCLIFLKIEWSEAMRPANGINRYQVVKVEEAFIMRTT